MDPADAPSSPFARASAAPYVPAAAGAAVPPLRKPFPAQPTQEDAQRQASAEDLQQQEASLAFIRSLAQSSGFVSSTTEWRRRQVTYLPFLIRCSHTVDRMGMHASHRLTAHV